MDLPKKKVLILGGGFGGLAAAKALSRSREIEATLVNRSSFQVYHPSLYEAATEEVTRETVIIPYQRIFPTGQVRFIKDEIVSFDKDSRRVQLKSGETHGYDYLIIALGAMSNDFGVPGVKEHALLFREFRETMLLRDNLRTVCHLSHERGRHKVDLAICGGGFSGIELAGELRHHFEHLAREFACPQEKMNLTILEAGPQILPGMPARVVELAVGKLKELKVEVSLGDPVAEVRPDGVRLKSGKWIPEDLTIWCAGTKPNPLPASAGLPLDEKGRPVVNDHLAILGRPEVYVVGDLAAFTDPRTGKGIAPQAHYAIEMGKVAAENVVRTIRKQPLKSFVPDPLDVIIPVGHNYGIAYLHGRIMDGWAPSLLRRFVEFNYLVGVFGLWKAWPAFWEEVKVVAS